MNTIEALVIVASNSVELSQSGNVYHKIEIQVLASKGVDAKVWTPTVVTTKTTKSKGVVVRELTMIRVSDVTFKMFFKGKLSNSNSLVLTLDEHINGLTTYVDSKGTSRVHGDGDATAVKGDISMDCTFARQATIIDLVRCNTSLDGSLEDVLNYLIDSLSSGVSNNSHNI